MADSWLEADKQGRKKQRHTAKRVYDRLKGTYGDSFDCFYRLVATYVAEKKKAPLHVMKNPHLRQKIPGKRVPSTLASHIHPDLGVCRDHIFLLTMSK